MQKRSRLREHLLHCFIGQNFFFEKGQIATMTGDFSAPTPLHRSCTASLRLNLPLQSQPASQTSDFRNEAQTRQKSWRLAGGMKSPSPLAFSLPRGRCSANSSLAMAVCYVSHAVYVENNPPPPPHVKYFKRTSFGEILCKSTPSGEICHWYTI